MSQRHLILVLGMHRSGTSAVTRVLNLLGARLGTNLMAATADNPHGYWEDATVIRLNDECLGHFGLGWDDVLAMPQGWAEDPWLHEWQKRLARHLSENYADAALVAIKDPRLCRLLPAWLPVLERLQLAPRIVMALRLPGEVALSLQRRDAMGADQALLLWSTYVLDAERSSRNQRRAFVDYQALLDDWRKFVERLAQQLELTWPCAPDLIATKVESFVDAGLRHRELEPVDDASKSAVRTLAESIYHLASNGDAADTNRPEPWDEARAELYAEARNLREKLSLTAPTVNEPPQLSHARHTGGWLEPADMVSEVLQARLYYRAADMPLDERDHVAAVLRTDAAPMHARFELPAAADFIRFDPAMHRGIYRLLAITINGAAITLEHIRLSAVHERLLASEHGALLRFLSDDTDPYVEFDIRALRLPPAQPVLIEFVFERDSLLGMLRRQMQTHEQAINDILRQAERKRAEMARIQAQTQETLARVSDASNALLRHHGAQDQFKLLAANWDNRGRLKKPPRKPRFRWASIPLTTVPTQQLRLLAQQTGDMPAWWSSVGSDPSFRIDIPGRGGLTPGWYVLGMNFCGADGSAPNPILYVDYSGSFDEADRIELAATPGATRQRMLVRFKQPVRGLRFDPSDSVGEFLLSTIYLRPISKVEVLARLSVPVMRRMRNQGRSWGDVLREGKRALRGHGMDRSIETLYANRDVGGTDATAGYRAWVSAYDTLTDAKRDAIRTNVANMLRQPLISVLLPVYNPPDELLRQCLDSVRAQLYPHWELCIADDASPGAHVHTTLIEYAKRDPRIKVAWREINGHISAASNTALGLATGDWIAPLDHDDLLPEHALFHLADAIATHPNAAMVYSDEDKIDLHGHRYDPYFKPDWNPELVLAQNLICHLAAYRTGIVRELGGFREGYEGSQDHDLALRYAERIQPEQILHIPRILYHWRAISGSTALATGEKSYAAEAGRKAVAEHLARIGVPCDGVTVGDDGYYRVKYALPAPAPKVSLIIPTRDRVDLLRMSVGSILDITDYPDFEIIIADNQSSDPETLAWFDEITSRDDRVRLLPHDQPFNFSRINNAAVAAAEGEIVGLINNDIEVTHADWLREMVSHAARKEVGAVGAKLYYPDGTIQHAGVILGVGGVAGHAYLHKPRDWPGQMGRAKIAQNLSAVTAACLLVRKKIYLEVGGMNEDLEVAFNDIDFCLRVLKAGYRNVWTPHAELIHHESASRGYEDTPEKQERFSREVLRMQSIWGDTLLQDPAYHPDLSLMGETFSPDPSRRRDN